MVKSKAAQWSAQQGLKKVLTIAGSDSGGGAGVQADLKTITVLGAYGMSAITALTAQNTLGVSGIQAVSPDFLALQLDAVLSDLGADAAKTGMLFSSDLIRVTARKVREYSLECLVVDPVMVSKSGHRLLEETAVRTLAEDLLPAALVATPNIPEAELLAGMEIRGARDMEEAASRIRALGPRCVIVKGGHLDGPADDLFHDGSPRLLRGKRIAKPAVHGTGCTFSAALATFLAQGESLEEAARRAKEFVTRAIAAAVPLGKGYPPANQLFPKGEGTGSSEPSGSAGG